MYGSVPHHSRSTHRESEARGRIMESITGGRQSCNQKSRDEFERQRGQMAGAGLHCRLAGTAEAAGHVEAQAKTPDAPNDRPRLPEPQENLYMSFANFALTCSPRTKFGQGSCGNVFKCRRMPSGATAVEHNLSCSDGDDFKVEVER